MAIYTRKGDAGDTGLRDGQSVPKNHVRIEALGTVDEANAAIGILVNLTDDERVSSELARIQNLLFEIGASLAQLKPESIRPDEADVLELEISIDDMTRQMPPLKHFILPGGTATAAQAHLARTFVRRAERRVVTVSQHQEVPRALIKYLNRLSDYLFTLARYFNHLAVEPDKTWTPSEE